MRTTFKNKKITGILAVLPEKEVMFDDEVNNYNFPEKQTLKLKKIMGFDKHRIVKDSTSVSDLCIFGVEHLLDKGILKKEEIDAIVLVTQSPDYFMPPTSNVIQGKLGLDTDVICMDINQGCSGFLIGLMQSFMLLDLEDINKVVLINADILSKKVSKKDRNSYPLIGDAATITVVEKSHESNEIYMSINMDGSRGESLIIPAGGFKQPCSEDTAVLSDIGDGNLRSLDNLKMEGSEVFTFVQTEVPPMINEIMKFSKHTKEEIDYFMFHQPNKFMLQKLADKLEIPHEKMPMNIVENFGNSSGCTIPINIVHNLGQNATVNKYKCCLSGFGSGLTWSSMIIDIDNLKFNESVISPF
jgi:3-oxoacyl-[acyl-carrier-protein] synthase-3